MTSRWGSPEVVAAAEVVVAVEVAAAAA